MSGLEKIIDNIRFIKNEIQSDTDKDGIRQIRRSKVNSLDQTISALEELQQYRHIGTLDECREASEKQKAKRPIKPQEDYGTFQCPSCKGLIYTTDALKTHRFCLMCGQALDWKEEV